MHEASTADEGIESSVVSNAAEASATPYYGASSLTEAEDNTQILAESMKKSSKKNTVWWQHSPEIDSSNIISHAEAGVETSTTPGISSDTDKISTEEIAEFQSAAHDTRELAQESQSDRVVLKDENASQLSNKIESPGEPVQLVFDNPEMVEAEPVKTTSTDTPNSLSDFIKYNTSSPASTECLIISVDPFAPSSHVTPTSASSGSLIFPALSSSDLSTTSSPALNNSPVSSIPELRVTIPEVSVDEATTKLVEHAGEAPPQPLDSCHQESGPSKMNQTVNAPHDTRTPETTRSAPLSNTAIRPQKLDFSCEGQDYEATHEQSREIENIVEPIRLAVKSCVETDTIKQIMQKQTWSKQERTCQEPGSTKWLPESQLTDFFMWTPFESSEPLCEESQSSCAINRGITNRTAWNLEQILVVQEPGTSRWMRLNEHDNSSMWTPAPIDLREKTESLSALVGRPYWNHDILDLMQEPSSSHWKPVSNHSTSPTWEASQSLKKKNFNVGTTDSLKTKNIQELMTMRTWSRDGSFISQEPGSGKWMPHADHQLFEAWFSPSNNYTDDIPIESYVETEIAKELTKSTTWAPPPFISQEPNTGKWMRMEDINKFSMSASNTLSLEEELPVSPRTVEHYTQVVQELMTRRTWRHSKEIVQDPSTGIWLKSSELKEFVLWAPNPQPSNIARTSLGSTTSEQKMHTNLKLACQTPTVGVSIEYPKQQEKLNMDVSPPDLEAAKQNNVERHVASDLPESTSPISSPAVSDPPSTPRSEPATPVPAMVEELAEVLAEVSSNEDTTSLCSTSRSPVDHHESQTVEKICFKSRSPSPKELNKKGLTINLPKVEHSSLSPINSESDSDAEDQALIAALPMLQSELAQLYQLISQPTEVEEEESFLPNQLDVPSVQSEAPTPSASPSRKEACDRMNERYEDVYVEPESSPLIFSDQLSAVNFVTTAATPTPEFQLNTAISYPVENRNDAIHAFINAYADGKASRESQLQNYSTTSASSPPLLQVEQKEDTESMMNSTLADNNIGTEEEYDSSDMTGDEDDFDSFSEEPDYLEEGLKGSYQSSRLYGPRVLETIPEVPTPTMTPCQLESMSEELVAHINQFRSNNTPEPYAVSSTDARKLNYNHDVSEEQNSFNTTYEELTTDDEDFVTPAETADFIFPDDEQTFNAGPQSLAWEMMNATTGDICGTLSEISEQEDRSHYSDESDMNQNSKKAQILTALSSLAEMAESDITADETRKQFIEHTGSNKGLQTIVLSSSEEINQESSLLTTTPDGDPSAGLLFSPSSPSSEGQFVSTPMRKSVGTLEQTTLQTTTPQSTPPTQSLIHNIRNTSRSTTPPAQVLSSDNDVTPRQSIPSFFDQVSIASSPTRPFPDMAESFTPDTPLKDVDKAGNWSRHASLSSHQDGQDFDTSGFVPRDITNLSWRERADSIPRSTRSASTLSTVSTSTIQGSINDLDALSSAQLHHPSPLRLRGDSNLSEVDQELDAITDTITEKSGATPTMGTPMNSSDSNFGPDISKVGSKTSPQKKTSGNLTTEFEPPTNQEKELSSPGATLTPRNSLNHSSSTNEVSNSLFMRMRSMFENQGQMVSSGGSTGRNRPARPGSGSLVSSVRKLNIPSGSDLGGYVGNLSRVGTSEEKASLLNGEQPNEG